MWRTLVLLSLLSLLGSSCSSKPGGSTATPDVFIALESDFASFRSWPRYSLGDGPLDGHPAGPRYGYLKQAAPHGATAYPVGAMIVKVVEQGATPSDWDVFAMVKRGGDYNNGQNVAHDWEYFTLALNGDGVPLIVSRGTNPVEPMPDVDAGIVGHGYPTAADGVTCNKCHGAAGTAATDHILSAPLAPGAQ